MSLIEQKYPQLFFSHAPQLSLVVTVAFKPFFLVFKLLLPFCTISNPSTLLISSLFQPIWLSFVPFSNYISGIMPIHPFIYSSSSLSMLWSLWAFQVTPMPPQFIPLPRFSPSLFFYLSLALSQSLSLFLSFSLSFSLSFYLSTHLFPH